MNWRKTLLPGNIPLPPSTLMSDQKKDSFLQNQYDVNQVSNENKEKYQLGDN